ncbi:FAD:protein FMN transferase [Paraferrimonas haliotis]|uniref:FAD:protein FMN transferase n=1 Tax=Paraferrimonas haliotis TaxID=2013866 RepID=A0AA37WW11_9GAMM|nr:FAD:protein FMN transferase [Paraferrimonas haliotis]GLS82757.1 FAD:protein FMN transferase [Paraferrimonas haliotis]
MYSSTKHWLTLLGLAFILTGCAKPDPILSLSGSTMGTTYHIKVVDNGQLPESLLLQNQIDIELEAVNNQMSTYRPKSEISRFNQMPIGSLKVSKDLVTVLNEGLRLYEATDGALDISIGPLINLWGFGPDKRPTIIPTDDEIALVKQRSGIHNVQVEGLRLIKQSNDLYLDLSSIAKGFGVDKVAELLRKHGATSFLVEIGGEVRTQGIKPDDTPWRIAIEKPNGQGDIEKIIALGDHAVATSGDYRNYYEDAGKRLSHIIDPRTGKPIDHRLTSVTVIHDSTMTADGYATALLVLGTEQGLKIANEQKLAAMFIDKSDDGFVTHYSEAFKPYLTTITN